MSGRDVTRISIIRAAIKLFPVQQLRNFNSFRSNNELSSCHRWQRKLVKIAKFCSLLRANRSRNPEREAASVGNSIAVYGASELAAAINFPFTAVYSSRLSGALIAFLGLLNATSRLTRPAPGREAIAGSPLDPLSRR